MFYEEPRWMMTYTKGKLFVPVDIALGDIFVVFGLADVTAALLGPSLLEILELYLHGGLLELLTLEFLLFGETGVHLHLFLLIRRLSVGVMLTNWVTGSLLGAGHWVTEKG